MWKIKDINGTRVIFGDLRKLLVLPINRKRTVDIMDKLIDDIKVDLKDTGVDSYAIVLVGLCT